MAGKPDPKPVKASSAYDERGVGLPPAALEKVRLAGRCRICPTTVSSGLIQCHHLVQRDRRHDLAMGVDLHDPDNIIALCWRCHDAYHTAPKTYGTLIRERLSWDEIHFVKRAFKRREAGTLYLDRYYPPRQRTKAA